MTQSVWLLPLIPDHTEQHRRDDRLRREAFQILKAFLHNLRVRRKDCGKRVAFQKHQHKYDAAEYQSHTDAGEHRLFGALLISRPNILRDERRHGLHQ